MAKNRAVVLPLPWQAARRPDGWWLQKQDDDGAWRDVAGPYVERGGAVTRWRRLVTTAMLPQVAPTSADKRALLAAAC